MTALDVLAGRAQWAIEQGDVLERLAALPDASVNCVVTSPPYWGLRDYGTGEWVGGRPDCDHLPNNTHQRQGQTGERANRSFTGFDPFKAACGKCGATRVDRQIGLEPTPDAYVARMVVVFREVRRVLRSDGTCWLNLGDCYASGESGRVDAGKPTTNPERWTFNMEQAPRAERRLRQETGLPQKNLIGIPWRVAFALQADGWWLRSDIVWAKLNPMPESVTDRPTRAHEMVFLLTKSARYAYDADAIREPVQYDARNERWGQTETTTFHRHEDDLGRGMQQKKPPGFVAMSNPAGRNKRTVWQIATEPYPDAHFATMPTALVEPCILAGAPARTCPACGAPWARVVERGPPFDPSQYAHRRTSKGDPGMMCNDAAEAPSLSNGQEWGRWKAEHPDKVLGWEPTCDCGDCLESRDGRHRWQDGADFCERCGRDYADRYLEPVPGVVLDPFCGSGTVLVEALRHGRRGIGVDLSPEYVAMARRRVEGDSPLFNTQWEAAT